MKKHFVVIGLTLLVLASASQAATWQLDKAHSKVGFNARHMVVTRTYGDFKDFSLELQFDVKDWSGAKVEVTVQTASIDTDNEDRDKHLRSADFLAVEEFPTMTFVSKKVIKGEGHEFEVVGDLTIKDITREVTLEGTYNGMVTDPMGNTRAGFTARTKINRQDFNVSWSKSLDAGGLVVSNEVTLDVEVEVVKAPEGEKK